LARIKKEIGSHKLKRREYIITEHEFSFRKNLVVIMNPCYIKMMLLKDLTWTLIAFVMYTYPNSVTHLDQYRSIIQRRLLCLLAFVI